MISALSLERTAPGNWEGSPWPMLGLHLPCAAPGAAATEPLLILGQDPELPLALGSLGGGREG